MRFSVFNLIGVLAVMFVRASAQDDDDDIPTSRLIEDAMVVVNMSRSGHNIEAGGQAETVYRAARRLLKEKKLGDALIMYENGLQLSPWSVKHYTDYAETLSRLDRKEKAERWARSAMERAEDQETREKARLWLKEKEPPKLPRYSPPKDGMAVCIVRVGHPPDWLVHRRGFGLENTLGIPVMLFDDRVALPPPNRNAFRRWVTNLRTSLKWDDPGFTAYRRSKGYPDGMLTDEQVVTLLEQLIEESRPPEELVEFRKAKLMMREPGRDAQWDAMKLIGALNSQAVARENPRVIWVGLTEADLYMNDGNYCFGSAGGPPASAIVSCARFAATFGQEPPDANRLCARTLKQLLSGIGMLLGAKRPIDPTCPRSYPQSLAEHDAKSLNLCEDCRAAFALKLGKELPPLREHVFEPAGGEERK